MSVSYFPIITNAFGMTLAEPKDFVSGEYTRVENDIGVATLVLPRAPYSETLFADDNQIEFWRSIDGGTRYRDTETSWLIYGFKRSTRGKEKLWTIYAACLNQLWERRIVDYNEYNAYTSKLDQLDDMGKAVIRENYGTLATDTSRRIDTYLSVQNDTGAAQTGRLSFAREYVYDVLRKMAETSWGYGTYLVFDTVLTQDAQPRFQFRSYTGQRGTDRRADNQLVFESGKNLEEVSVDYDSRKEVTRAIIGGQGVATTQAVARYTTARATATPFGLKEAWENNSQETDAAGLQAYARALTNKRRARKTISGVARSVPGAVYGRDWFWGDRCRAKDENDEFDARIPVVNVKFSRDNNDDVTAQLHGELMDG